MSVLLLILYLWVGYTSDLLKDEKNFIPKRMDGYIILTYLINATLCFAYGWWPRGIIFALCTCIYVSVTDKKNQRRNKK